jgi:hypothetical protein
MAIVGFYELSGEFKEAICVFFRPVDIREMIVVYPGGYTME